MDSTEEKEKFRIRLDWEDMSKEELRVYIGDLHSFLMDFETSSIKQMVLSLDMVAHKISDDLDMIASGEHGEYRKFPSTGEVYWHSFLTILKEDKDDRTFDRLLSLLGRVKDFKEVAKTAESLRPEVQKKEEKTSKPKTKIEIPTGGNAYEALQKRIEQKRNK